MTERITRTELLRRGAGGGAVLAVPGLLAACGGGDEAAARTTTAQQAARRRRSRFSNWPLYIDIDEKTKRHPSLDAVHEEVPASRSSTSRTSTTTRASSGRSRGRSRSGQSIDRDMIVMTDNSRFPALLIETGWLEKLDKSGDPEHQEPAGRPRSTRAGTRTASTACRGSRA